MTIIMVVAGFLFCSVSAYMAGLVGSSNNPGVGHHHLHNPCSRRWVLLLLWARTRRAARWPRS